MNRRQPERPGQPDQSDKGGQADTAGAPDEALAAARAAQAAAAGLAREVEAMQRAMKLVATTTALGRVETAISEEIARLARLVTELSETVAAHATAAASTPGRRTEPEAVPSWLCAPLDQAHVRAMLSDLTSWMDGIYLRYSDAAQSMPECWLWHPDVIEELLWLMYAWLAAYQGEEPSVRAAGDWHDRLRPGVVRRIRDYASGCSIELHLRHRATPPARVPGLAAADAIAGWWADARRDPAPEPTKEQLDEALAASNRARPGGDTP